MLAAFICQIFSSGKSIHCACPSSVVLPFKCLIILENGRTTLEGQNKTCLALVADKTATAHFQLWGDECDSFGSGDIIYLSNGIFSYHRGNLVLRAGKLEKIGEFTMSYVETPNMSEIHWIPDPANFNKYMQKHVISPRSRIFPPIL
jgi:hypothetical protein